MLVKFFKDFVLNLRILSNSIFSISIFDDHYVIYFFGILIRKKIFHKQPINTKIFEYGLNTTKRKCNIIASLTTFPERIGVVSETIKTLLVQTVKPDKLILWLAKSQFPQGEIELPKDLITLKEYGLTIEWCDDLKSYKKIIPALKQYPKDIILTFDDDIYYDNTVIESLYKAYLEDKTSIQTNRFCCLKLCGNKFKKLPKAYEYWGIHNKPSFLNTIIGCGGVLYPPNSLNKEVFNSDKFQDVLPTQDDIWLWAMALLNKTKINIVSAYKMNIRTVEDTQKYGLCNINKKGKSGIDGMDAINLIIQEYPEILQIIREDVHV